MKTVAWLVHSVLLVAFLWPVAARPEDLGRTIELPPVEVKAGGKPPPPWQYVSIPGCEVLSRCSNSTTREFLEVQDRLTQLFALVVPPEFQHRLATPKVFILVNQDSAVANAQDVFNLSGPGPATRVGRGQPGGGRFRFLPNMWLEDRDTVITYARIDERTFDPASLSLSPDHVFFLLAGRRPQLPAWVVEGVMHLFRDMSFRKDKIEFARFDWIDDVQARRLRANADLPHPFFALVDLVGQPRPPSTPENAEAIRVWSSEAALLVRWMLDGDANRRAGFWKFVERSMAGPVDDALCNECFGFGYADLRDLLSDYLPVALTKTFQLPAARIAPLPSFTPHVASPSEIGRLKGDWERLELAYVKARYPQFADRYVEQARRTLNVALGEGDRDPRLLTVLGLFEADLGNSTTARQWLEVALSKQIVRPRAHYELAHARYTEALAHPDGARGLLSPVQVNTVLEPLKIAYGQPPPLPEIYHLAAQAWSHSTAVIEAPQLSFLDEGLKIFPDDLGLLYDVASLKVIHGLTRQAADLATRGAELSADVNTRERFTKMLTLLESAKPEPTK